MQKTIKKNIFSEIWDQRIHRIHLTLCITLCLRNSRNEKYLMWQITVQKNVPEILPQKYLQHIFFNEKKIFPAYTFANDLLKILNVASFFQEYIWKYHTIIHTWSSFSKSSSKVSLSSSNLCSLFFNWYKIWPVSSRHSCKYSFSLISPSSCSLNSSSASVNLSIISWECPGKHNKQKILTPNTYNFPKESEFWFLQPGLKVGNALLVDSGLNSVWKRNVCSTQMQSSFLYVTITFIFLQRPQLGGGGRPPLPFFENRKKVP